MNLEVEAAIRIADKHLAGTVPDRRAALAKDIIIAIRDHAMLMASDAIRTASSELKREH